MRLAFMGTPGFAVPTLDRLVADGHEVAAVYTQPPRRAGRGGAETPSPVQRRAEALGLAVRTPPSLRDEAEQRAFAALELDAAVVAAYGLILPPQILGSPRTGCLNIHASLLPRWRGAAPIERAILAGDERTGVTIMSMEKGLDTGPMRLAEGLEIGARTAPQLRSELARLGAELMSRVLAQPGCHPPHPQPAEGVTYAAKIEKHESRLDFSAPALAVERQVRAFAPTAHFLVGGERVRVLEAVVVGKGGPPGIVIDDELTIACGSGALAPRRVQRAGRGVMDVGELLRGFPIPTGTRLA